MIKPIYLKHNLIIVNQNYLQINIIFNFIYSAFLINVIILSFIIYFIGEFNLNPKILFIFLIFSLNFLSLTV